MAVAARRDARMSVAEHRAWVDGRPGDERWELLDGEPLLMAPPRERHQQLVANLVGRLGDLAERQDCRALPGLAILCEAVDDFAPFPDVVVRCGAPRPDGYASDPILIAEVLSSSTMSIDRGRKSDFYRTIPSLLTFLIVYQDEARIEVWRRDADWSKRVVGLDDAIDLPDLGGRVSGSDVDARVAF